MICDYVKISGTGEALLDYNVPMRVQLEGDHVQGFDTKWDGVLLSMTQVPEEDLFENLFKS